MAPTREAEELLLIEEADAWFEYLEATRGQTEPRYREVEPWAWARLEPAAACCSHEAREAPPGRRSRLTAATNRTATLQ